MNRITRALRSLFGRDTPVRCWPGCLAQVVSDGSLVAKFLGGKTVTVTKLTRNNVGNPAWEYEGAQFLLLVGKSVSVQVDHIPDAMLRPLTPPPGTVTDSEVRSLFAPDVATTKEREKSNSAYSASRSGCAFTGVA